MRMYVMWFINLKARVHTKQEKSYFFISTISFKQKRTEKALQILIKCKEERFKPQNDA